MGQENSDASKEARELFFGTAPERSREIEELLDRIEYKVAHDRPALHVEAGAFFGKGLVVFTNRTMQQIWLVAYLSWRTLHEQSGFIIVSLMTKKPYDTSILEKNDKYIANIDRLVQSLKDLRTADTGSNPWPADVPQLDPNLSKLRDEEDVVAHQLACFAASFVLLHETQHALKRADGQEYSGVAEELECDRFALVFLLHQCHLYAIQKNYTHVEIFRKRAMGVVLGLAVTFESTELGVRIPSQSHPSAYERIMQLIKVVDLAITDPNDHFWVFACCILLSKVRRDNRLVGRVPFQNTRELFYKVLELMRVE